MTELLTPLPHNSLTWRSVHPLVFSKKHLCELLRLLYTHTFMAEHARELSKIRLPIGRLWRDRWRRRRRNRSLGDRNQGQSLDRTKQDGDKATPAHPLPPEFFQRE